MGLTSVHSVGVMANTDFYDELGATSKVVLFFHML